MLSVDGLLQFFEGLSMQFSIQMPDFIIPGPIAYLPILEQIVIYNKGYEIEAYQFKSMMNICTKADVSEAESRLYPEWSFVLGEMPLDIKYIRNSNTMQY